MMKDVTILTFDEMEQIRQDIHHMLATIWMERDFSGSNAFDDPVFCTLAEKYDFTCNTFESVREIMKKYYKKFKE